MKTDSINGHQAHPKSFFICTQGSWFDVIQANEDHSMNWWCMPYVVGCGCGWVIQQLRFKRLIISDYKGNETNG